MEDEPGVELSAIGQDDIRAVAQFMHRHLNTSVSAASWAAGMKTSWLPEPPNRGFMLTKSGEVVGANLAFYSERTKAGGTHRVCNLGALCVLPAERRHTVRLMRALLRQPGFEFTDLSPSGSVVELNRRLRFTELDTSTRLVVNTGPLTSRHGRVIADLGAIERSLRGDDLKYFQDHRSSAAVHHLMLLVGDQTCYIMVRKDRRKKLPLFVSFIYVSNAKLLSQQAGLVFGYFLWRLHTPFTLVEQRVAPLTHRLAVVLSTSRPKMYKSRHLDASEIDYLYSELTEIPW